MKGKKTSDNFLVLVDISEKAINEMKKIIVDIIEDGYGEEQAWKISETLTEGNWTHDYPITVEEAVNLGLNIKREVPDEVYRLMAFYPQAHQRRPGIEYLPLPMRPTTPGRERGD